MCLWLPRKKSQLHSLHSHFMKSCCTAQCCSYKLGQHITSLGDTLVWQSGFCIVCCQCDPRLCTHLFAKHLNLSTGQSPDFCRLVFSSLCRPGRRCTLLTQCDWGTVYEIHRIPAPCLSAYQSRCVRPDVPYEEESGVKYWLGKHGERLNQDPRVCSVSLTPQGGGVWPGCCVAFGLQGQAACAL